MPGTGHVGVCVVRLRPVLHLPEDVCHSRGLPEGDQSMDVCQDKLWQAIISVAQKLKVLLPCSAAKLLQQLCMWAMLADDICH